MPVNVDNIGGWYLTFWHNIGYCVILANRFRNIFSEEKALCHFHTDIAQTDKIDVTI
jgi:hypothetical protein